MARTAAAGVRALSTHDDTTGAHPRFAESLRELGLEVPVRRFPDATRTAAEAAEAIGCDVSHALLGARRWRSPRTDR